MSHTLQHYELTKPDIYLYTIDYNLHDHALSNCDLIGLDFMVLHASMQGRGWKGAALMVVNQGNG
jgi:hypothetical protein